MNINLRIERLILDGLPVTLAERGVLQAAIETELTQLLVTSGLNAAFLERMSIPSMPTSTMQWPANNNPTHLGQQIARSVYSEIGAVRGKES